MIMERLNFLPPFERQIEEGILRRWCIENSIPLKIEETRATRAYIDEAIGCRNENK